MNKTDFENLLLLYGANLHNWPADSMRAAEDFVRETPDAKALLEEARALDGLLITAAAAEPAGSALVGRILARVDERRTKGFAAVRAWRLASAGTALAASMAGFGLGFVDGAASAALNDAMFMAVGGADVGLWWLL